MKPIFANKATNIYHDAKNRNDACRKGEIKKSNREDFDSPEAAEEAGRVPCKLCCKQK